MKLIVFVALVFVAVASGQIIAGLTPESFANVTYFGCDANGTVVWDPECQMCVCYSGFFGCQCQYELLPPECTYVPFDPLAINAATPFAIDQTETGFDGGNLTIVVYGAAIEKTATTARVTFISVGKGSLANLYEASLIFNETALLQIIETPNPCRCFVKSAKIDSNGDCDDVYVIEDPWTTLRDCCKVVEDSIFELVFDCTLDVFHFDEVVLSTFPGEPTRGQSLDNPLPLFVKFAQSVNATQSNVSVFADIEVQAYIADQSYDLTTNIGTIQIDIVTNWPYELTLTGLEQLETALFTITGDSLGPTPDSNTFGSVVTRPCDSVVGSVCWQTLTITVVPLTPCNLNTLSVVNLDNVFNSTYSVSCRTASCPNPSTSDNFPQVSIVATINTENFCPFVEFKFPLNGTLSAWNQDFSSPETDFIVYADPIGTGAQKICLKGTADVDYEDATPAGQGNPGEAIIATYFHKLYIFNPSNGDYVEIYDDSLTPALCQLPDCAYVVIDTSTDYNNFATYFGSQSATTAGACFYLSTDLLAGLNLDFSTSPVTLDIEAVLGVIYSGAKKAVQSEEQIFTVQSNIQASAQNPSKEHEASSASLYAINTLLVFGSAILCLFF